MVFAEYTLKGVEETLEKLKSNRAGLTEKEIEERLCLYGPNEIRKREKGVFYIFWRQIKSPFFYLLSLASLVSFLIGEETEALFILFFVFLYIFLGFIQEAKAHNTLKILKRYLPSQVLVRRSGIKKWIDKKELVPGDIVILGSGDIVPADLRIIEEKGLLVDESILTGESVPVNKEARALSEETKEIFEAKNILFAGTSIIGGTAEAVVFATGNKTVIAEISRSGAEIKKETLYEKELLEFARLILRIVVVTIVFIYLANLIIKGGANSLEFLIFCIALIVSILPEALPAVVSFSLSLGVLKLAKERVVVKRLAAVESLGGIEVLCTDKTGTLTENKLTLERIFSVNQEKCLKYGLLSSCFVTKEMKLAENSFDKALLEYAGQEIRELIKKIDVIFEIPFDSYRMRNSVLIKTEKGKKFLICKGAPDRILDLCSKTEGQLNKKKIKEEIEKEGKEGKRVIAIAYKEINKEDISEKDEKGLIFLGYFSFKDPLKKTAVPAIHLARKLGVEVKILTGDSPEVAGRVAQEIGIIDDSSKVITGKQLEALSPEEFKKICREFSVFARLSPSVKYKIIKTLQEDFEVGFLGEGINDIPALEAAHVSIVVESACDMSRESADIVLLKKDLGVLIDGIKTGRKIFANINKYIKTTLASNFGNFYSLALISLIIPFLPMLPVQILFLNFLSDIPLFAIVTDAVDVQELRRPKFYRLNKIILLIFLLGLISSVFDFIFFGLFHKLPVSSLRTLWFIESLLTEIALIFSIRTSRFFFKTISPSRSLTISSLLVIILSILVPFLPLGKELFHFVSPPMEYMGIVLSLVLVYFMISESVKLFYFHYWFKPLELVKEEKPNNKTKK